jgi:hypothetical protein
MFIRIDQEKTQHTRTSKLGVKHEYQRRKSIAVLRCDSCSQLFNRPQASMDPKRLNNNVFHVCPNCDPKRFAQKKGAERKIIWEKSVNSSDDISKL